MSFYEIRVQGHLDQRWTEWFDGLTISYEGEDITVLRGALTDEAVYCAQNSVQWTHEFE